MDDRCDVAVVGSGVAGALFAWKLSTLNPGRTIRLLEAGRNELTYDQREEFHHAMIASTNRTDMHAPYSGLESRTFVQAPENAAKTVKEQQDGLEKYYDQQGPDPFKAQYLRQVGGTTWAWRGNTPRFLPNDFRLKSTHGRGIDWPDAITYDALETDYVEAERELGVSGDRAEWDDTTTRIFGDTIQDHFGKRSGDYPMPAIAFSSGDAEMASELEKAVVQIGDDLVPVRVFHTPQARTSRAYRPHDDFDERPACEGNSNCIPLCPIGAKYDATVHLKQAITNGVVLQPAAVVTRLECDPENPSRVSRIYYRRWDQEDRSTEHVLEADVVVLAANAIETPKILLLSASNSGLANSSHQVGCNLMDHLQDDISFFFPRRLYPFRGPQSLASIEVFRDGPFRKDHSAIRMTIGNDGAGRAPGRAVPDVVRDLLNRNTFGEALVTGIEDTVTRLVRIGFSTEVLPNPQNRVTLSDKMDVLGIPRPQLHFTLDEYTNDGLQKGHEIALDLARGIAGVDQTRIEALERDPKEKKYNTAAHIMGTCRMGDDPTASVVDADGRSHDIENLFIVGSSVFPTSGTANPTLTLAALTLRTAKVVAHG